MVHSWIYFIDAIAVLVSNVDEVRPPIVPNTLSSLEASVCPKTLGTIVIVTETECDGVRRVRIDRVDPVIGGVCCENHTSIERNMTSSDMGGCCGAFAQSGLTGSCNRSGGLRIGIVRPYSKGLRGIRNIDEAVVVRKIQGGERCAKDAVEHTSRLATRCIHLQETPGSQDEKDRQHLLQGYPTAQSLDWDSHHQRLSNDD